MPVAPHTHVIRFGNLSPAFYCDKLEYGDTHAFQRLGDREPGLNRSNTQRASSRKDPPMGKVGWLDSAPFELQILVSSLTEWRQPGKAAASG